jgi:hypothetical protein
MELGMWQFVISVRNLLHGQLHLEGAMEHVQKYLIVPKASAVPNWFLVRERSAQLVIMQQYQLEK